jgi:FtsH ternary system-associated peptide
MPMKTVSRFEANLLRVLHCLMGRVPVEQALPIVLAAARQPRCLSRDAVALVRDALAKGCVQWLARAGAWRRERHLRGERAAEGRLWERTPPADLALRFSPQAISFLIWLTAVRPGGAASSWRLPINELTPADGLLLFIAYETLRDTEARDGLRSQEAVQKNALCRLAYPQDFLQAEALTAADFLPWTTGLPACMLEVLQVPLKRGWVELETAKARIDDWETMQRFGHAQEQVLKAFLGALEQAERFDLARFVLEAVAALVTPSAQPRFWVGGLKQAGPRLADRTATHRAALALVRQMERLRQWERRARGVGYLDEGYAASQLWKADWERCQGDALHARAQALVRQLEPLTPTGGTEP